VPPLRGIVAFGIAFGVMADAARLSGPEAQAAHSETKESQMPARNNGFATPEKVSFQSAQSNRHVNSWMA
jgi:hypothetical protein